jgi:hypothetical protein
MKVKVVVSHDRLPAAALRRSAIWSSVGRPVGW